MQKIFIVFLCCLINTISFGQARNNNSNNNFGQSQTTQKTANSDSLIIGEIDTFSNDVFSYSLDKLSTLSIFLDTTVHNFEEYEMTRNLKDRYIHLGNVGSSATPILWQNTYNDRFTLGFTQHQPYKYTEENIQFFKVAKPYSKVYYSNGDDQSSFRTQALLAREFKNNVQVTLKFNRINSSSIYQNTGVRHTNVHLGVFQKIDSSKWAYSVNFLSNSNYEQLNGGIVNRDELFLPGFTNRSSLDVLHTDINTYELARDYNFRLYYFLSDQENKKQYLQLKLNHTRSLYKFINSNITSRDSLAFGPDLIRSELGMRRFYTNNRSDIKLSYHLENKVLTSKYWVRYGINQVGTDFNSENINEIVGGGNNQFEWKGLNVNLDGYFGTVYNKVLLDLNPSAGFNYKDKASINFGFRIHTEPSAHQLNYTEIIFQTLKNDDPKVISSQEIYGNINIPYLGFSAKLSSFAGQNIAVLDTAGLVVNFENIQYLHLDVSEKLRYKWLNFNNRISTQIRNENVYNMPVLYSQHELFLDGLLFDKLAFQSGFNVDFVPAYSLPSYSPLYGRFYQSSTPTEGLFYRIDVYASIKVQGFRFFAKYENLNDLWDENVIYEVRNYPQLDGRFRLGISWELRN